MKDFKDFYVLSKPYVVSGDNNSVSCRVQTLEFPNILLHNDRTLHKCVVRVTNAGRTYAAFPTEDYAYLAINDYYVMHGQHTPYVRVGGLWCNAGALNTGQTTDYVDSVSEKMEFE